jgi:two-component system NtrC family sensor kinase
MHKPNNAIIQEMDITEKRILESNLIQSEKLAAVGQLAAGVAHEINNPLSAIIANAQIQLQMTPEDDDDKIEAFKLIEAAGLRASRVVHNLLSISRKESQNFEPTNVNETIQNALLLIQYELVKQNIRIDTELSEQLPLILAHKENIQSVWINLFLNAIDAIAAAKRPEGVINIKTSSTDSEIHVVISDNGIGIEPEKVNKIFEPFYTTKASGHGTGLGLSVCMRTIREHQGNITVESKPDQGTHFIISLPLTANSISE